MDPPAVIQTFFYPVISCSIELSSLLRALLDGQLQHLGFKQDIQNLLKRFNLALSILTYLGSFENQQ